MVGVGVKVARRKPVELGTMVCEGARVAVMNAEPGVAVHVGGKLNEVGVELGMTTCAGKAWGGKGLNIELGATKILVNKPANKQIASKPSMERTSQNDTFTDPDSFLIQIPSSVSISYF